MSYVKIKGSLGGYSSYINDLLINIDQIVFVKKTYESNQELYAFYTSASDRHGASCILTDVENANIIFRKMGISL